MARNVQVALNKKTRRYHLVEVDSTTSEILFDLGALQRDDQKDTLANLVLDTNASTFQSA